jgi:hypothetical protein
VKRSPMPRRRAPLASRGWAGNRRARLARTAPIRSNRKRRSTAEIAVREAVFRRDGGCILAGSTWHPGRCFGPLTPHHLRKEGQGGSYTAENLVSLCAWANGDWVELHPIEARRLGLTISGLDTEHRAWCRMQAAGLVNYGPDGGPLWGCE